MSAIPQTGPGAPEGGKAALETGDDLFLMANLFPEDTGLPFVVWISPKGNARHDARIKIARAGKATEFVASVGLRPEPHVAAGELSPAELALAAEWIALNLDVLLGYWDGSIARTKEALDRLQPLPPAR